MRARSAAVAASATVHSVQSGSDWNSERRGFGRAVRVVRHSTRREKERLASVQLKLCEVLALADGLELRSVGQCFPGGGDGFESSVDAEGLKETAYVVPDCLGAQVELGGDLLRRVALLQQTKHLDLTGGEMRVWRCRPGVGRPSNSPKTPTTRSPLMSGTELISTATRVPAVETKTPLASVAEAVPSTFRENSSRARRLSSGATTEVNWRPRTAPTSRSAAGLIHRTIPVVSRT
jgi:hypothetical protein